MRKKNRAKLLIVQPYLTSYRLPVFAKMSKRINVFILSSRPIDSSGFGIPSIEDTEIKANYLAKEKLFFSGRLIWQVGWLKVLLGVMPDKVLCAANPRLLSYWLLLLVAIILRIEVYSHGQGLYAYPAPTMGRRFLYRLMVAFSNRYICYTEYSMQSLLEIGCPAEKLAVAHNSIEISSTIAPQEKSYTEDGVLFIGRLREGCRLEHLVDAVKELILAFPKTRLHVIGTGELQAYYLELFCHFEWIIWHGSIHDDRRIAEISRQCRVGCYPGDAGLSVVHFFGLSLPPLVHDIFSDHMGPEPTYVRGDDNGFLFSKSDKGFGLNATLHKVWCMDSQTLRKVGESSFSSYQKLNNPPLSCRLLDIIMKKDDIFDDEAN